MPPGATWGLRGLAQGPNSCADLIMAAAGSKSNSLTTPLQAAPVLFFWGGIERGRQKSRGREKDRELGKERREGRQRERERERASSWVWPRTPGGRDKDVTALLSHQSKGRARKHRVTPTRAESTCNPKDVFLRALRLSVGPDGRRNGTGASILFKRS